MTGAAERVGIPDLFTYNAARALGVEDSCGIEPGRSADFVVLDSAAWDDLIIDQPEKRYVVKRGKIIVENRRESLWREPD